MSVAEIDLTRLEPGPEPSPDGAPDGAAPAGARRSLTGLAPRRTTAVSRLRREARVAPEPEPPAPQERAGQATQTDRQGSGVDSGRTPGPDPRRAEARTAAPARPDQGARHDPGVTRPAPGGARPPVDPRTGAPARGPAVPGRAYPPSAPGGRGPAARQPPPGYRPGQGGQVPVRQRPAAVPPYGRRDDPPRPAGPAGPPMAPAAQAALAQAAAARAAMAVAPAVEPSEPLDESLPRYLQLVRKEARVRSDQAEWMAMEVRRINSSRRRRAGVVGERITDNTLIRVALDLLRAQGAALEGTTEDELIRSVLGHDPA